MFKPNEYTKMRGGGRGALFWQQEPPSSPVAITQTSDGKDQPESPDTPTGTLGRAYPHDDTHMYPCIHTPVEAVID